MATSTEQWLEKIDLNTQAIDHAFGGLGPEKLNWKSTPDQWSIAQNIDHLMVINRTYFPIFEAISQGRYRSPWLGRLGFLVRFSSKVVLNAVQPNRQRKGKTFGIWEPSQTELPADMLDHFRQHQQDLKAKIVSIRPFWETNPVISSPANRNIIYPLQTAVEIIVVHEQRHLEQAKEVLALQHA